MTTETVNIQDKENQLKELLKLVAKGTEVILQHNNVPLARLSPLAKTVSKPRVAGLHQGLISMSDDFDAPLPDDFWLGTAA